MENLYKKFYSGNDTGETYNSYSTGIQPTDNYNLAKELVNPKFPVIYIFNISL